MKNEKYYVGLDIGTDSVGYAVTGEAYDLCKFKGEPMWGVTLFDEAQPASERRTFRTARRRLDRRQQRVRLVQELFAEEIAKTDAGFFKRIKESYLFPETKQDKVRLFDTWEKQKEYTTHYPTIHHLIVELMQNAEPHDARLVFLACAWLVAHRGHFLNEVDKSNISAVVDFESVYTRFAAFIQRNGEYALPWRDDVDLAAVADALKHKAGVTKKAKAVTEALFGGKAPKLVNEQYEYNYELVVKLLCGGKVGLKELFDKEEYADLEEKSVALSMDDEKLALVLQSIGDDAALITVLKELYDWSILVDILNGKPTISEAKVGIYNQHKQDLKTLKRFVKKYLPGKEKYQEIFRSESAGDNYVAYIGKNKTANAVSKAQKTAKQEDFCKYLLAAFKSVTPDEADTAEYQNMISRLEAGDFCPKQVDGDNRVIPYQLYWFELNAILENAKGYLPFLNEADADGITGAEKVLSVFEFRVPYYVGPLKEKSNPRWNHWMVRKAAGKIYPWNFDKLVDLDASENAFIRRMTNSCTYLPGEDVLPKNSMVYCSFQVLNEINNIKINGNAIPVAVKQELYNRVFMDGRKVTPTRIKNYLLSANYIGEDDVISGLDITVKSSLKPYLQFQRLLNSGLLTLADVENIINRATYSEDRTRFTNWLRREYPALPDSEVKYISGLKFKDFGRLSKRFLCGVEGVNKETGEFYPSILRAMWETNCNLMQLLSDKFTFSETVQKIVEEYYGSHPKSISEQLDEWYVSNAVKRPIIRTLDILHDVVKVQGRAPERIFIEMARGANEDQKGKRTKTRLAQLYELYDKVKDEDVRRLTEQLEAWGETAHNRLQSDKLFLYFIQLGKCLYTGKSIDLESVIAGDGTYNIEHIYPRSFVKDDSVINNEILVDSQANGDKSDRYPVDPSIQNRMRGYWERLHKLGLISDEKFKRLIRATPFTAEEKFEFINRQLVETRQSTKAVAALLKERYPQAEIVYVKAGLVSDFRQQFKLPKSRMVNDLHHAKDAYLNIVAGNVWHCRFSRLFWRAEEQNNAKVEVVFSRPVVCNGQAVWNGAVDKERVVRIARKNTAHITKYAFCRKGGFFDQMPVSAAKGLVPLKKGRPTEIYGGYNKSTASFFVLVKYTVGKKQDIMVMPVEWLFAKPFAEDERFALNYAAQTVEAILGKPVTAVEFLLNKRPLKVNTVLSLNGFRVCITGKSGGGKQIGVSNLMPFKTSPETEAYIKRLESFENKRKKNSHIVFSEKYDGLSAEKNVALYDCYVDKLQNTLYCYRPANPCNTLMKGRDKFVVLSPAQQVSVLLAVQGLFGRAIKADLTAIGGVASAGVSTLSSSISNWKKNYTDVRVVDQSASGLFETVSENLLELL